MIGHAIRSPWSRLATGLVAIVALYATIFPSLAHEWSTFPSLSHGFAVPLVSAYLVYARRADLRRIIPSPSWAGLPLLVAGLALYVLGTLGGEPFVARVSLLVSLGGIVLFLAGGAAMRGLLPAVAYLGLMIPLPYVTVQGVTDTLRLFEATASAWLLPWLGVAVLQEGFLLHLPNITLEVAEVCSSVSAITALVALGAAFGYVTRRPIGVHVALILIALPLGVGSNIVRIALTAAGAYHIGPVVLESVLHTGHGTVVFLMTIVALSVVDLALVRLRPVPR